jgi:hypothetical protein
MKPMMKLGAALLIFGLVMAGLAALVIRSNAVPNESNKTLLTQAADVTAPATTSVDAASAKK